MKKAFVTSQIVDTSMFASIFLKALPAIINPQSVFQGTYVRTYVMYIKQYFHILCGCVIVQFYCNILTDVHVCTAT